MTQESSDTPDESGVDVETVSSGEQPVADPSWGPDPRRTWADGDRPPSLPTAAETASLLDTVETALSGDTITCIRVRLADPSTMQRVLKHLRSEPTVLETSSGERCGPAREDVFDVLLAPEQEPFGASAALMSFDDVVGVSLAKYPLPLGEREATGRWFAEPTEGDDESHLDYELTVDVGAADADSPDLEPPEEVFEELKAEVDAVEYDDLLDELDAADVGTADGVDVDLDPVLNGSGDGSRAEDPSGVDGVATGSSAGEDQGDESVPISDIGPSEPSEGIVGALAADDLEMDDEDTDDPVGGESRTDAETDLDPSAVLSALVTALNENTLRESEVSAFRDVLGLQTPESLRARVDHMQMQMNELLAYREDLEQFIDETEGGRKVGELESEVSELSAHLETLAAATQSIADRMERYEERQRELATRVGGGEDRGVGDPSDGPGTQESAVGDAGRSARSDDDAAPVDAASRDAGSAGPPADERVTELAAELESLREWREQLESALAPDDDGN